MEKNNETLAFHCTKSRLGCGHKFESDIYETEDYPQREWLPHKYFAECPECDMRAVHASWQIAQWKAISDHGTTGPVSEKGRLAISQANKDRDPDSYRLSRFNALSHGLSSTVAQFFPARPGNYDICESCEYLNNGCGDDMKHCAKRTELFVQFKLAEEEGDGRLLGKLMAGTQAGLAAITMDMVRNVAVKGVMIETPEYYIDKETGKPMPLKLTDEYGREVQIMKAEANPLLSHLINFIQKNNTTLGDMGLTPAAKEEERRFDGYLEAAETSQEQTLEVRKEANSQMAALRALIQGKTATIDHGNIIDAEIIDDED